MFSIVSNSGPASISMSYSFAWNVEEYISVSKTFQWEVGEGPLFWYVVESYPVKDCDIHPTCKEQCLSLSVLASSVCDLCGRLKEQRWNHKIRKVYKWSRPALECDVLAGEKLGKDYSCNKLEDETPAFIKCPECSEFLMPLCDGSRTYDFYHNCISYSQDINNESYDDFPCVWYSEYLHIDPIVNVGDELVWGQKIGTIADTSAFDPHLHWGVGDGCGGLGIGQTIDFDGYFGDILTAGTRSPFAPPPGTLKLSPTQVDFIKSNTIFPLDKYYCQWASYYASPFHGGVEYYAQDFACSSPTDVNDMLLAKTIGANVYNTCGSNGPYIKSEVVHIADVDPGNPATKGQLVYVRHTKLTMCIDLPPVSYTPFSLRSMGVDCYCEGPNSSNNCGMTTKLRGIINDITKVPSISVVKPGFNMNDIKIMTPQVDSIITKCGILPSNLKLKHNLAKTNHLKQFLVRNKLKLQEEVDLVYSKSSNSWQNVVHLNGHNENWTIAFSWLCSDDGDAGNFGWRSDIYISTTVRSKKQNTRIRAAFASHGMLDGKNLFGVNFNYNTSTNKVTARQPVIVKNKTMCDEIGMFAGGDWVKDPYLTVNVSVDKKG